MEKLSFILSAIAVTLFIGCSEQSIDKTETVNPILGDISFIDKFGYAPDDKTNDNLRIQTHLKYVEHLLRQKEVTDLSPELQARRNQMLDLLHSYWMAGIFPRNNDNSHRKPCFIDKDNRICAVGYLVEHTAGRQIAEEINRKHQYDEIYEMNSIMVDSWIAGSGFTKEEVAMIQPTYQPPPVYTQNYVSPVYGITSSVLSAANLSFITINGIQIANGANKNTLSIVGICTGAGQLTIGIASFPKLVWDGSSVPASNESRKVLSMLNIGIGTTTMILSTWNLIANRKPKDQLTSWNIYSFPTEKKSVGMGFSLARRF